jgi:hypothetical protein
MTGWTAIRIHQNLARQQILFALNFEGFMWYVPPNRFEFFSPFFVKMTGKQSFQKNVQKICFLISFDYFCVKLNPKSRTMKKIKRLNLNELQKRTSPFEEDILRSVIGGSYGSGNSHLFSWSDVNSMMDAGTWNGGWVNDNGNIFWLGAEANYGATVYGGNNNGSSNNNGWSNFLNSNPWIEPVMDDVMGEIHPLLGAIGTATDVYGSVTDPETNIRTKIQNVLVDTFFGILPWAGSQTKFFLKVLAEHFAKMELEARQLFIYPQLFGYDEYDGY